MDVRLHVRAEVSGWRHHHPRNRPSRAQRRVLRGHRRNRGLPWRERPSTLHRYRRHGYHHRPRRLDRAIITWLGRGSVRLAETCAGTCSGEQVFGSMSDHLRKNMAHAVWASNVSALVSWWVRVAPVAWSRQEPIRTLCPWQELFEPSRSGASRPSVRVAHLWLPRAAKGISAKTTRSLRGGFVEAGPARFDDT